MSFGEVDTLNMMFEKLNSLLDESQGYHESFLAINGLYKKGQIGDKEFFQKMGDYLVAYSSLQFLAVKALFELKKSQDTGSGATKSPGLMPGMGNPAMMMGGGMPGGGVGIPPRAGTAQNPIGGPPGIVSAKEAFDSVGTLPSPDPALLPGLRQPQQQQQQQQAATNECASCHVELRPNAKFCTKCGARV